MGSLMSKRRRARRRSATSRLCQTRPPPLATAAREFRQLRYMKPLYLLFFLHL